MAQPDAAAAVTAGSSRPFRVIIAGGSLVGLTSALALEHAGIDYVLLEKGDVAPNLGASISIHPHTQRVMEQLGVWPEVKAGVIPLTDREHFDEHGKLFEKSDVLRDISKMCLNRQTSFMTRQFWLQSLYNQIRNLDKVRAQTPVTSYVETEEGVTVTTGNGETIEGDILIGADGIHSPVRQHLADEAEAAGDAAGAKAMRSGFVATYQCIFATSKNARSDTGKPFLAEGMVHNVYYRGYSGVVAAGMPGLIFWFLYVKSDAVTRTPNTPRFSEEQTLAIIEKYGGYAAGPDYTFRDLWDSRVKAAMLPLEEGVLSTSWHSRGGRVILVGDSVHKATVNPGLGGNLAVEGVVHLMNGLVPLIRSAASNTDAKANAKPSRTQLTEVFATYEKKQRPHGSMIVSASGYITRYEAMATWWLRLLRVISPWISDKLKAKGFAGYIREGPWLNYLPNPDDEKK